MFGLVLNLPIVNDYAHGTCLTVHHGHAALRVTLELLPAGLLHLQTALEQGLWYARSTSN